MAHLDEWFVYLKKTGGSDLHLSSGTPPHIRRHGVLEPIPNQPVLTDAATQRLLRELVSEEQWKTYSSSRDLDFAYALPKIARFRANFFFQEKGAAAVFRMIPEKIQTLDELQAPPVLAKLAQMNAGLVLVTGPTGSGKSTTLAAIIDAINTNSARHIVTIEDPVEFVHANKKSTLSQREVSKDTKGFAAALRSAIRQDAEVILVGEMRDFETISLAITASEMGALVFGTLHTNSAAKTIDRVIDAFPSEQQAQARTMLADSLGAVVSQLLLRKKDGSGRVAVHEILLKTQGLGNIIRENNLMMIGSLIQGGKAVGMQSMDDALLQRVQDNSIEPIEAYQKAQNKKRFEDLPGVDGGMG